ncbi:MAG: hypothetical protein FWC97_08330, partial [Treponema sp.]|nr:hypothetical protein [Treponema sp.]
WSGYKAGDVPADLASACLELAAWNMNRYRGRRIGVTGNKDERVDWLIPVFTRTGRSLVTRRLYRSQKLLAFFINILYYFR